MLSRKWTMQPGPLIRPTSRSCPAELAEIRVAAGGVGEVIRRIWKSHSLGSDCTNSAVDDGPTAGSPARAGAPQRIAANTISARIDKLPFTVFSNLSGHRGDYW